MHFSSGHHGIIKCKGEINQMRSENLKNLHHTNYWVLRRKYFVNVYMFFSNGLSVSSFGVFSIGHYTSWTELSNFSDLLSVSQQIFDIEFPEAFHTIHKICREYFGVSKKKKKRKGVDQKRPPAKNYRNQIRRFSISAVLFKYGIILVDESKVIFFGWIAQYNRFWKVLKTKPKKKKK